jgi:hypothetical protein
MENIKSSAELKSAIQNLEAEQTFHKQLLKDQFFIVHESLKPANLIRNTFNDIASSSSLTNNIMGAAVGLATGFVTKKIALGLPGSILKKLLGILLQVGVTDVVTHNPDSVKSFGRSIYRLIFHRKNKLN